jgi:uncharacterized protein YdaU (DUF1376 family)
MPNTRKHRFPYYKFYVQDHADDTQGLTVLQSFCYREMLDLAWKRHDCELPNDPKWIGRSLATRATDLTPFMCAKTVPWLLNRYWRINLATDQWEQPRQKEERAKIQQVSEIAAEAGRQSGKSRRQHSIRDPGNNLPCDGVNRPSLADDHGETTKLLASYSSETAAQNVGYISKSNDLAATDVQQRLNERQTTHTQTHTQNHKINTRTVSESSGLIDEVKNRFDFGEGNGIGAGKTALHQRQFQPGSTTLRADQRLARFTQWLAPLVPGSWLTINAALDPTHEDHKPALATCKRIARENGKGWPHLAPQ